MLGAATFALVVSTISPAVSSLHREAKVVDLHSDTLLDVASGKRDISRRGTAGHIDLPRLREGGVDVQVFAAFIHPREAERGFERALELLDAFDRMVSSHADVLGRALTFADIEQLERSGKVVVVLSRKHELHRLHLRIKKLLLAVPVGAISPQDTGAARELHRLCNCNTLH